MKEILEKIDAEKIEKEKKILTDMNAKLDQENDFIKRIKLKYLDFGRNYIKMVCFYETLHGDIRGKGRMTEDKDVKFDQLNGDYHDNMCSSSICTLCEVAGRTVFTNYFTEKSPSLLKKFTLNPIAFELLYRK